MRLTLKLLSIWNEMMYDTNTENIWIILLFLLGFLFGKMYFTTKSNNSSEIDEEGRNTLNERVLEYFELHRQQNEEFFFNE